MAMVATAPCQAEAYGPGGEGGGRRVHCVCNPAGGNRGTVEILRQRINHERPQSLDLCVELVQLLLHLLLANFLNHAPQRHPPRTVGAVRVVLLPQANSPCTMYSMMEPGRGWLLSSVRVSEMSARLPARHRRGNMQYPV